MFYINAETQKVKCSHCDAYILISVDQIKEGYVTTCRLCKNRLNIEFSVKETPNDFITPIPIEPVLTKNAVDTETKKFIPNIQSYDTERMQVRPWIRFWARVLDNYYFTLICGLVIGIIAPSLLNKSITIITIITLLIWAFMEAFLLSTWGTTPGKYLLAISLKDINGQKPSFSDALKRSCSVWFFGLFCGLPFIYLVFNACSYYRLAKSGTTLWDCNGGFTVTHGNISIMRGIIVIFAIILVIAMEVATRM